MSTREWTTLLQFSDGLFPAGAYAHSFGLEWYVQAGLVGDAASLGSLVRSYLEASVAPTDAVALLCSWKAARAGEIEDCLRIDAMVDALKAAEELRNASRQMGRQTLRIANSLMADALIQAFYSSVESCGTAGHHPVALGIVGNALQWEPREMIAAYLYSSSAMLVNSALRLFPLGQLAGQRVLWNLQPLFGQLAAAVLEKREQDIWSFTPALEIAAMRHSTLDARLFRS
ncbi:MAG: urease accessory protein UreF [Terracidiphilus sp.]